MAETFPDEAIVHTLCAQLSWSHFKRLLAVAEPLRRDFYAQLASLHRWSVRELDRHIDTMLYKRSAVSRQPEVRWSGELGENWVLISQLHGKSPSHETAAL